MCLVASEGRIEWEIGSIWNWIWETMGSGRMMMMRSGDGTAAWRTSVLAKHLSNLQVASCASTPLYPSSCLAYGPPESNSETPSFNKHAMRRLLEGHDIETRDRVFNLMIESDLFVSKRIGDKVLVSPNFNQPRDDSREQTVARIRYLQSKGVFNGWATDRSYEGGLRHLASYETLTMFDHSLIVKIAVHYHLWTGSIQYLGTKRHHDKWLKLSEDYKISGCFALSELGHGSNVRGIETIATYDPSTQEFVIHTPCESAQKTWIGGAGKHATHTVVFANLLINGRNEGVHGFVCQLRDAHGYTCPGIRIADNGQKVGVNGVDNGRIWFDKVRIPRENLLNAVADVTKDGQYESAIKDPDQRFSAFMGPLTAGRVNVAMSALNNSKIGLAIALRYALSRRAFSVTPDEPEMLLLDYPSHQRRLLPLLAKSYAMSFAGLDMKKLHEKRRPEDSKIIHVLSSGYKAIFSWQNLRTLQECREACGGYGLATEDRVGQLRAEYDVTVTFEGDNNVLMQQVSKALVGDYMAFVKKGKPMKSLGLEYMNGPQTVIPHELNQGVLRDSQFQLALFRLRESGLLKLLTEHISNLVSKGIPIKKAFNTSSQLGGDLARAFLERSMLESFLGAERQATGEMKEVLGLLQTLYVLSVADEDPVFLRYGYLSSKQSQLIHNQVSELCGELRRQALHLVDSFGIPQPFLGTLAFDWVESNSSFHVESFAP